MIWWHPTINYLIHTTQHHIEKVGGGGGTHVPREKRLPLYTGEGKKNHNNSSVFQPLFVRGLTRIQYGSRWQRGDEQLRRDLAVSQPLYEYIGLYCTPYEVGLGIR